MAGISFQVLVIQHGQQRPGGCVHVACNAARRCQVADRLAAVEGSSLEYGRKKARSPIVDAGPSTFNLGTLSLVGINTMSEATQDMNVTFTDADDWNVANGHINLQMSRPQNPTINFFRGPYQQFGSVNGVAATPVVKPTGFAFVAGQRCRNPRIPGISCRVRLGSGGTSIAPTNLRNRSV